MDTTKTNCQSVQKAAQAVELETDEECESENDLMSARARTNRRKKKRRQKRQREPSQQRYGSLILNDEKSDLEVLEKKLAFLIEERREVVKQIESQHNLCRSGPHT